MLPFRSAFFVHRLDHGFFILWDITNITELPDILDRKH